MAACKRKVVKPSKQKTGKSVMVSHTNTDKEKVVWLFDNLDAADAFAFNSARDDFDAKEVMDKLISYSTMTWGQIKSQTHDNGKSKHHFLSYDTLSKKAKDRVDFKHLYNDSDSIFSFALKNKLRIIGIREGRFFHVIWYAPQHKFCPSHR